MTNSVKSIVVVLALSLSFVASTALACPGESAQRSVDGGDRTTIRFNNQLSTPVDVYWLDYQGQRRRYATIAPGGSWSANTYMTHPWVVTQAGNGTCVGVFLPLPNGSAINLR